MEQNNTLLRQILHPSEEFTPFPFWFFNDTPDRKKIKKQLEDYVEKGVNGLVLHPRIGVPKELPYLSEEYFEVIRYIVECADALNMKIVLYDEGMYPSGSAHGMVVAANPDFASKGITIADTLAGRAKTDRVITDFDDEKYLVYGFTGGTIRGIHFGEDDGEAGAPASADILNPKAVDMFLQLTHDRYYDALKEYFGNTIIAFFTDEPSALGRNAGSYREWLPGLEGELLKKGGNLQDLRGLFTGETNFTITIYHKLIKKHLREIFYGRLSQWCESHGIALMGHPEVSDDVEEEFYFHIPGQDLIMRRVAPETGGLLEFDSVQGKITADIARHLGRRRNANECFGVCNRNQIPWYFTGMDMKWYINWLGFRGVNLFVPHAFYYSVEGARKDERPPDVGPNNIWWSHYKLFSDYMKRLSYIMTDSFSDARVAVLCDNNRVPYKEVRYLYENRIDFHYLPIALLAECHVEEGILCTPVRENGFSYRYRTVLNVLAADDDSRLPDSVADIVTKGVSLVAKVEEVKVEPAVVTDSDCQSIRATRLEKCGKQMVLLANEGSEAIATNLYFSGTKAVVCVDIWNGMYETGCGEDSDRGWKLPVTINPCEMLLVILDGEPEGTITQDYVNLSWKRGTAEDNQAFLGDLTDYFTLQSKLDNKAEYSFLYYTDKFHQQAYFTVTGEEMAECYCNGNFVGVSFQTPHSFCIGSHLRNYENEIKLVFTGNAANIYENAKLSYGIKGEK